MNPKLSIKPPNTKGIIAPPTIAIHSKPDAWAFKSPKPSKVNVKIVGNIIELNNPTAKIDHIDSNPCELMETTIITMANNAKILNTLPA